MANIQIYGTLPGGGSDIEIATEINAQSTNEKAAGAKAVYDVLPTNFTGTDGTAAGASGLVPAPTTTDTDKFLKSDGTWEEIESGGGELEKQGVFIITLSDLLAIDTNSQKNITDTTEKNKFLPVVQFMFDNLRVTPVILLKSTEHRNSADAMPAVWLTSKEDRITERNSILFFNMELIHPRSDTFSGKINRISLSISYSASNNVVTSINSVVISRGDDVFLEQTSNKVTTITSSSTDTQYPSAKAVYSLQQEDIILEGEASWLMGGTVTFDDAEDITKLNHFKELTLAGKHPRFGFSMNYLGSISTLLKEPDEVMTIENDGTIVNFTTTFTAFLPNNFGLFGIQLDYAGDSWSMTISTLNQS